jgi:hypothetical protein
MSAFWGGADFNLDPANVCKRPTGVILQQRALKVVGNSVVATTRLAGSIVESGQSIFAYWLDNLRRPRRLSAAATPEAEAEAAAAAAANATATAATATAAAATPATATAAAAASATPGYLHAVASCFRALFVEQIECRQTDVRDFLFTQRDRLCRREVEFLRDICSRRG